MYPFIHAGCLHVHYTMRTCCFLFVCLSVTANYVQAYKAFITMHGIFSSAAEMEQLFSWIKQAHPGTETYAVDLFDNNRSLVNMEEQVDAIQTIMAKFMQQHPEGINILGYSQGGLACRGVLEHLQHNVDTFISLSSPQAGQFGDTDYIKYVFPHLLRDEVYRIAYTKTGQNISISNYWNDPHHQDLYVKFSKYLAVLNNDSYNARSDEFKSNFLRLKKMVMIGGPDDGVITPWQSSQFGFYDENLNVRKMEATQWYARDSFGLRTMNQRGSLVFHTVPGVQHTHWLQDRNVFEKYILPHLT